MKIEKLLLSRSERKWRKASVELILVSQRLQGFFPLRF